MTEKTTLDLAKDIVGGGRQQDYGDKQINFERIAGMWTAYLNARLKDGEKLSPRDISALYMLGKIARIAHNENHFDSWLDIAGYTEIGASILTGTNGLTVLNEYLASKVG